MDRPCGLVHSLLVNLVPDLNEQLDDGREVELSTAIQMALRVITGYQPNELLSADEG